MNGEPTQRQQTTKSSGADKRAEPARAASRRLRGKPGELGLQRSARASHRRQFRVEFLLVSTNEAGNRVFQLLAAGAAFPASRKMGVNDSFVTRRELSL